MSKQELEDFKVYIATYKTTLTKKFRQRKKWFPPDRNKVTSVIPGTIVDILVKPKQKVKSGETLLVLEAMKMANRIIMLFNGVIKSINVQKGEIVPKNHVMVEIYPEE